MPNHVTTVITGPQKALASLLDDAGRVDFEYLVPPPANLEKGGCSGQHEPGVVCWYSWNVENWGTKWNAYSSEVSEGRLRFDTAWAHPDPVIRALALKHPDVTFSVEYADEDLGHNLGSYEITGTARVERPIDDPNDFAAQLKYGQSYAELRAEWDEDDE